MREIDICSIRSGMGRERTWKRGKVAVAETHQNTANGSVDAYPSRNAEGLGGQAIDAGMS
jgi:hypothetical protein